MSPAGLAKAFAGLAAAVLSISVGFAMAGAWLVLPFAGLELLALGAAYLAYARRFGRQEEERLSRGTAK
jgi:uncharacterized membrane protein